MDIIFSWIGDNYPLVLIGIAIIYTTFKISGFYFVRFKRVEQECDKISGLQNTAIINGNISNRIEKNIDEKLLPKLDGIVNSVHGLLIYLSSKDRDFKSEIYVVKSPVQLSLIGIDILEKSNGKKFIEESKDALIKEMES